jgi:hypothetical protein
MASIRSESVSVQMPNAATLNAGFQLALEHDVKLMADYWTQSLEGTITIGVQGEGTEVVKILVKNDQEYTSPIIRIIQPTPSILEYLIMTENSIYVVHFQNIRGAVRQIQSA